MFLCWGITGALIRLFEFHDTLLCFLAGVATAGIFLLCDISVIEVNDYPVEPRPKPKPEEFQPWWGRKHDR